MLLMQIIPPPEWCPRSTYDDIDDFLITTPISQLVTGQQGVYQLYNIQKKPLKFAEYSQMADSDGYILTYSAKWLDANHDLSDISHQQQKIMMS